jgi:MFS family permease
VFYGWIIVALAGVVMTTAYGAQFSFGVLLPYMEADTGWDRELLTRAFAIYIFMYAFLSLISGPLTDRIGPRPVIMVGGALLGLGYWLLAHIQAEWEMFIVLGAISAAGMSASFVPCNATVVRWFIRYRGRAIGITTMGASLGNLCGPPIVVLLVETIGWRDSLAWIGIGIGVLIVTASFFMVRDPSEKGLLPDGDPVPENHEPEADQEQSWTLAEARRTPAFWIITAIFLFTWLVVFLPAVHLAAYAMDLGIDPVSAAWILSSIGLGGVIGRPLIGAASDRSGRLPALAFVLATQVVVFVLLPYTNSWEMLCLEAFGFGFGYGGTTTIFPAMVGDYFGRSSAGAIVGFIFSIAGSSAALGPWLAAYVLANYGSYDMAFWFGAAVNCLSLVLILGLKRSAPHRDEGLAQARAETIS